MPNTGQSEGERLPRLLRVTPLPVRGPARGSQKILQSQQDLSCLRTFHAPWAAASHPGPAQEAHVLPHLTTAQPSVPSPHLTCHAGGTQEGTCTSLAKTLNCPTPAAGREDTAPCHQVGGGMLVQGSEILERPLQAAPEHRSQSSTLPADKEQPLGLQPHQRTFSTPSPGFSPLLCHWPQQPSGATKDLFIPLPSNRASLAPGFPRETAGSQGFSPQGSLKLPQTRAGPESPSLLCSSPFFYIQEPQLCPY